MFIALVSLIPATISWQCRHQQLNWGIQQCSKESLPQPSPQQVSVLSYQDTPPVCLSRSRKRIYYLDSQTNNSLPTAKKCQTRLPGKSSEFSTKCLHAQHGESKSSGPLFHHWRGWYGGCVQYSIWARKVQDKNQGRWLLMPLLYKQQDSLQASLRHFPSLQMGMERLTPLSHWEPIYDTWQSMQHTTGWVHKPTPSRWQVGPRKLCINPSLPKWWVQIVTPAKASEGWACKMQRSRFYGWQHRHLGKY